MYKSRQKIIGVSLASFVVLAGFAIGSWAIIDASNRMPRGDANVSRYQGLTKYLGDGSLNINKMSISDWVNLNYPTKILVEGLDSANYSLYYFTTPDQTALGINEATWTQLKDPVKLLELTKTPSSPLICKIEVKEENNSYTYSVKMNEYYTNGVDPLLATLTYSFSDENKTSITSFSTSGININKQPLSVVNDVVTYDNYSMKYTHSASNNDRIDYKMDVSSLSGSKDIVYSWELRTTPSNNFNNFQVINTGTKTDSINATGIYSTYTNQQIDSTDTNAANNYKIYNIAHQTIAGNTPGASINKQTYQTWWITENDNTIPKLHLPNSIGLISFLPPINKKTTTQ